jgi:hypothetical protein
VPTPKDPLADLAADLLPLLHKLHHQRPTLGPPALTAVLEALLVFGHDHQLLRPTPAKLTPQMKAAAGKLLREALDAAGAPGQAAASGSDRTPSGLRFRHGVLQVVSSGLSFYSFAAPYTRTVKGRTTTGVGLTTIDSSGGCYPTLDIDRHLPRRVAVTERAIAACSPHLLCDPPPMLRDAADLKTCLTRLSAEFPTALPFRDPLHERRLRVWSLMTYLYPLVPSTPFLRVRVPDISSARNVQLLLEACCFNALGVYGRGNKAAIRRHRDALAGATIFSPELRTGRLPAAALDLLERPPRAKRHEPPVAWVEVWDETTPPRVPEAWIVDVELAGRLGPVPLPEDFRHLGCAVALADGGALVAQAPVQEGTAGVARWLQELIYGDQLSDGQLASAAEAADQAEGFVVHDSELAGHVERVWAGCLQEEADEGEATGQQKLRCNAACLRQRLMEQPGLKTKLASPGWDRLFTRRLLEEGVVTYTVRNLRGCLSPVQSAEWMTRNIRGVEVPASRLPAGSEL